MSTFPQIFLTRSINRRQVTFKIGGYSDLEQYLITTSNIKNNRLNLDVIIILCVLCNYIKILKDKY